MATAQSKQPLADPKKVTSHSPYTEVLAGRITIEEYALNAIADAAAVVVASGTRPPTALVNEYNKWQAATTLIAKRIAFIEAFHWTLCPK